MITAEDLEQRIKELEAKMAQVQEIASRHGPEHRNEGLDPVPGYHQDKDTAGAPTHEAPGGTRCRVIPDNAHYINRDGGTAWTVLDTGGAGAPMGALYLVLAADGDLTAERVLTPGTGLVGADAGPGLAYTLTTADDQIIHDDLSGGGVTSAHHVKYTDSEARDAVPYVTTVTFGWDPQSPQVFAP